MKTYNDPLIAEWKKVEKVILSYNNWEQIVSAFKYWQLWKIKNSNWLNNIKNPGASYIDGVVFGIMLTKAKQYGSGKVSDMEE